jgi:hypothetical protein
MNNENTSNLNNIEEGKANKPSEQPCKITFNKATEAGKKDNGGEEVININEIDANSNANANQQILLNQDYYDEFNRPKYDEIVNYENQIRAEIESSSPLVSEKMDIVFLVTEFKDSIYENIINVFYVNVRIYWAGISS